MLATALAMGRRGRKKALAMGRERLKEKKYRKIQVFAMPLQNKQKGSTREQKNKCMGKSGVWAITFFFFLFVIFKMSLYTFVTLSFS